MIAWKRNLVLIACGLATCVLVPASTSEAHFFGRLKARRAARQAYRLGCCPTTAYYGGWSGGCFGRSCGFGHQCGTCCPQTCQPACQVVARCVPQTCYRNSWTQVAVTSYRPVQSCDPCTGCPVTCMRPCTCYRWQLQRVPYTTYRTVYTTVASPCTTCGTSCGTSSCSSSVSGTCSSCGVGASTIQGAVIPSGVPSGTIQGGQPIQGGTEADTPPALPNASLQGGTNQYVLQSSEGTSSTGTESRQESAEVDITPIPDLQAPLNSENSAPRLLNENDRQASLPIEQDVVAHPITWSNAEMIEVTSAVIEEPISAPASELEEEVWDDSGWEAVR